MRKIDLNEFELQMIIVALQFLNGHTKKYGELIDKLKTYLPKKRLNKNGN